MRAANVVTKYLQREVEEAPPLLIPLIRATGVGPLRPTQKSPQGIASPRRHDTCFPLNLDRRWVSGSRSRRLDQGDRGMSVLNGPATIPTLSAIGGSIIGALSSMVSTWIAQRHRERRGTRS